MFTNIFFLNLNLAIFDNYQPSGIPAKCIWPTIVIVMMILTICLCQRVTIMEEVFWVEDFQKIEATSLEYQKTRKSTHSHKIIILVRLRLRRNLFLPIPFPPLQP